MYQFEAPYDSAPYDSLTEIYRHSLTDNFALPALTDYTDGKTITYGDMARRIARLHLFFRLSGVRRGDKIALLGRNTPNWVITFMATVTYGATIVPVLQDFNPSDAANIIDHSDAILLFVADGLFQNLDFEAMPQLRAAISLDTRTVLTERNATRGKGFGSVVKNLTRSFRQHYPDGFGPANIEYPAIGGGELAIINYTSGTTGFSKGVMLTHDNLRGNVVFGIRSRLHYQGSRVLSFLPLAHAYGCAFDMLVPLAVGSHVTLLCKTPTPQLLLKALRQVRPSLIICVPLILFHNTIQARGCLRRTVRRSDCGRSASQQRGRGLPLPHKIPLHRRLRNDRVRSAHKLFAMAALRARLVGPYTAWNNGSAHTPRQHAHHRHVVPAGRGLNVMKGYYKNPEATEAAIDAEGWLHTGDMGYLGSPGERTVFIRGRYKTMILSSNGQNIYPEEIESKLSNMPYVNECLVIQRNGHLVALCHPDADAVKNDRLDRSMLEEAMENNRRSLNKLVAPYEQVEKIEIVDKEFEKTPKRSIRRFLYK